MPTPVFVRVPFWIAVCAIAACPALAASGAVQPPPAPVIDIPTGAAVVARLGLPPCIPRGEAAREACAVLSQVLRDDLDFEGLFAFVDLPPPVGSAPAPAAPDLIAWRSLGADFLVATTAALDGGELAVELSVWAVASQQSILVKRFTGSAARPRFFAHTLSDAVMSLTSLQGVARTRIAFVSDRSGDYRTKDVYVADYDGHGVERFSRDDLTSILPDWSPRGTHLAYTFIGRSASRLVVAPLAGGEPGSLCPDGVRCVAPEWSPDGSRIAYSRASEDGAIKIWVCDADGRRNRQVSDGPGVDTAPTWSPTGQQIAFTSDRSGTPQVWAVGAEGLGIERLTRQGSHNDAPSWSPSSAHGEIAYSSRLSGGRLSIAVMDIASGEVRHVSGEGRSCEKPTWSPSGRHLMFACRQGEAWQLAVADRLGRRVRMLDTGPGTNSQPAWGPFRE